MSEQYTLHLSDCLDALKAMPDCSVDSIVTDPPYGLAFMGKKWDYDVPSVEIWREALRVLKDGGHLLSFGGTRTYHRMVVNIEDAGFEIRDQIQWLYGSGFPKGRRVNASPTFCQCGEAARSGGSIAPSPHADAHKSTAEMAPCGAPPHEDVDHLRCRPEGSQGDYLLGRGSDDEQPLLQQGDGQEIPQPQQYAQEHSRSHETCGGSDSGPKHSPCQAQRSDHHANTGCPRHPEPCGEPLGTRGGHRSHADRPCTSDRTLDSLGNSSCVDYGAGFPHCQVCGKPNADGWNVALKPANEPICLARKPFKGTVAANVLLHGTGALNIDGCRVEGKLEGDPNRFSKTNGGDFNTSLADGNEDRQPPKVRNEGRWPANVIHDGSEEVLAEFPETNSGGGVKSKAGHNIGLLRGEESYRFKHDGEYCQPSEGSAARFFYCAKPSKAERNKGLDSNNHPTVKPVALMRYLCRLITPPEGIVLEPFLGSGTTGVAALLEGFRFIGIEREPEYMEIAKARLANAQSEMADQVDEHPRLFA